MLKVGVIVDFSGLSVSASTPCEIVTVVSAARSGAAAESARTAPKRRAVARFIVRAYGRREHGPFSRKANGPSSDQTPRKEHHDTQPVPRGRTRPCRPRAGRLGR